MTAKLKKIPAKGDKYNHFIVTKCVELPEIQCVLTELEHLPTGAHVMHIFSDDPENLFCLSFRTLPKASNGVAHILEHTVLCGSKKFPVKDPFFSMTRRSLNTFMNALTGSDFTCYPASSQVHADFYNLLDVYIDAVFHPLLQEFSFMQEGWRLEFQQPTDINTPLEYKGIVFNEMKGVLSSPSSRLAEYMNHHLFPHLTYGVNSGGDPKEIPSLTYQELLDFHKKFYHPSRCLFFFYGNMPLEGHLDFIEEKALKGVQKVDPIPPLPKQPRFEKPKKFTLTYPLAPNEEEKEKTLVGFGWLTSPLENQMDVLALNIIEIILLDTDASPLKKAFLRSGLCKQVSSFLDDDLSEVPFTIFLKGCMPGKTDELEKLMRNTLRSVVDEGISLDVVESAMHQLEFYRSEIAGDHTPHGLSLFMRSALLKQNNAAPEEGLRVHSLFEMIRKKIIAEPSYLPHLIKKMLLDNSHFVSIEMQPDKDLAAKEDLEEKLALEKIKNKMNPEERQALVEKTKRFMKFQSKQEETEEIEVDVLPKLSLADVPFATKDYALIQENFDTLHVFHHPVFTNGIVYADLIYDLPFLKEQELPLVRLFSSLISQVGCGGRDYSKNLEYIQSHTGGIGASLGLNILCTDPNSFKPSLIIRGKALQRKVPKLFSLLKDIVLSVDFSDVERIKEILIKNYSSLESGLNSNALRYAINLSSSGFNLPLKVLNEWHGLEYFWKIQKIVKNFDSQLPLLIENLEQLKNKLLGLERPHLVISCDGALYDSIKSHHFYGLQELPQKPYDRWYPDLSLTNIPSQGRLIASPVAFTAKTMPAIPFIHPDAAALAVCANLLDNINLHTRIREQGGAYGGGASCNLASGTFYFYSYRDPNIIKTLDAFDESIEMLVEGEFDKEEIEESILEIIQALDAPVAPGTKGMLAYGWYREGKSLSTRQSFRNKLLTITKEEIIEAAKSHIVPFYNKAVTVVFAGKELLEKENIILKARGSETLKIETI